MDEPSHEQLTRVEAPTSPDFDGALIFVGTTILLVALYFGSIFVYRAYHSEHWWSESNCPHHQFFHLIFTWVYNNIFCCFCNEGDLVVKYFKGSELDDFDEELGSDAEEDDSSKLHRVEVSLLKPNPFPQKKIEKVQAPELPTLAGEVFVEDHWYKAELRLNGGRFNATILHSILAEEAGLVGREIENVRGSEVRIQDKCV